MDLKRIMSNIYGESSSQTFDNVILGGKRPIYKRAQIHYLDEVQNDNPVSADYNYSSISKQDYDMAFTMSGGGKRKHYNSNELVIESPMYVNNPELQDFIKSFYLYYLFSHLKSNTLIIVPSQTELNELKQELDTKLKGGNIKPNTIEASKFTNKESLGFKHYIFDVYGGGNNDKFDYKIDSNFPESATGSILRRTNRLGEVYYFKFEGPKDILVSCDSKLSKPSKLSFVAKCSNDCFILKGAFPKCSTSKGSSVYTVSGGKLDKNGLQDAFVRYCNKYEDVDTAAYKFIGALGLSAMMNGEDPKNIASRLANYYSADFVHSALSMITDGNKFTLNDIKFKSSDINKMHKLIIDAYSPKQVNIEGCKVKDAINSIYSKSKHYKGNDRNRYIITQVGKMYGNYPKSMYKADIGTALIRSCNNSNERTINHAFNIMNSIDAIYTDTNGTNGTNDEFKDQFKDSNALDSTANAVYASFVSTPFIGVNAKCSVPMIMSKSKKSLFKSKISNKAFEDNNNDLAGEAFEFKLDDKDLDNDLDKLNGGSDEDDNGDDDGNKKDTSGGSGNEDDDFSIFY